MDGGCLALPPGFRFHPTDEELVKHYLCQKCLSQPIAVPIIAEVDLYKFDPWQLPGMARYGEKEWYFFSPRDRKYPNGSRPNRAAGSGYWKATGADKPIGVPKTLGIKKALVFYAGKAPKGEKTNWIMHEYRLADVDRSARNKKNNNLRLDDWVLCRIYNKKGAAEKNVSIDRKAAAAKTAMPPLVLPTPTMQAPKVEVMPITHAPPQHHHQPQPMSTEYAYFDSSDSIPRPPPDSSSEHVLSTSEFAYEKEVQSQPARWNIGAWERPVTAPSSMAAAPPLPPLESDFSSVFGDNSMLQDIMMFLQKPF